MKKVALALLLSFVTASLAVPANVPIARVPVVSHEDVCLAWVVDDEARGEPIRGQRAVYDVVKHRMATRKLTACEVVKERGQFSGYHQGMRMRATEEMLQRLKKLRRIAPVVSNASYFHNSTVKPTWASKMQRILTIGRHIFYGPRKFKEKQK